MEQRLKGYGDLRDRMEELMEDREARKDQNVPPSEPDEQEDEQEALDEAFVADVFKKYQPVSFG